MAKGRKQKPLPSPAPKSIKHAFYLNAVPFKWSLQYCRWEHDGWQVDCKGVQYFVEHVVIKLQTFETQTWQEILNASGGKVEGKGNNNHFISADKLPTEERKVFIGAGYMRNFEKVFSLRLSAKERLIGVVDMNVFRVLWYDAFHRFF